MKALTFKSRNFLIHPSKKEIVQITVMPMKHLLDKLQKHSDKTLLSYQPEENQRDKLFRVTLEVLVVV